MNSSRRQFITQLGLVFAAIKFSVPGVLAQTTEELKLLVGDVSNFKAVYGNQSLQQEFLLFLKNVFHLYPEKEMHQLIADAVKTINTDKEIYETLQVKLSDIAPFLKDITYSIPALSRQKKVMTAQTIELLGGKKTFNRYLEIGSTGRYLDGLEEQLTIGDERYFIADREHSYSPADMVDRGQIAKAGEFIALANYQPKLNGGIATGSVDLMCVYIGFHHCPIPLRNEFISSLRDLMSADGKLILRDHNVNSQSMWHMVGLAHDIFNMGTMESWNYNAAERRNFYSLEYLAQLMQENGLKTDGRRLYQEGDPTKNALMVFTKS